MIPVDESHWVNTPMTTRHSQIGVLLVSFTWGLSYCMPESQRVAFSEVYPPDLSKWSFLPMWGWGVMMLCSAACAFFGERMILANGVSRMGWGMSFASHAMLTSIYATLAVAALVTGAQESAAMHWQGSAVLSALSRPVLWLLISFLHLTYARLPHPEWPKRHKRSRRRLRLVQEDEE